MSKKGIILCALGSILLTLGLTAFFVHPKMIRSKIIEIMVLSEDSEIFDIWRTIPIPISVEIYVFNVTNADDVQQNGSIPKLQEVGPYIFKETREKINITWNDNGTVSYRQIRRWYHVDGDLQDEITAFNVPFLFGVWFLQDRDQLKSFRRTFTKQPIFIKRSAGQLLVYGYHDELLDLARTWNVIDYPTSNFGWFNMINNSDSGIFNVFTGAEDSKKFVLIERWNGNSNLTFWESSCNNLKDSTAGEIWPPFTYDDQLSLYVTDFCRPISLKYEKNVGLRGFDTRRYSADDSIFDTGTIDEENNCFCKKQCFPLGAMQLSPCFYGAPVLISLPHFLMADPIYQTYVEGLSPDITKHQSFIYLEPQMGLPVSGKAQFQISVYVEKVEGIAPLKHINETTVFPQLWFSQTMSLPDDLRHKMRLITQQLPLYVNIVSCCLIGLGAAIIVGTLLAIRFKSKREDSKPRLKMVKQNTTS